ncbi:MAG: hypothetical protein LBP54_07710, partial [Campylobacteraceae bacterium]|nr:hypothetical protein [Campylobacteraceae bacterium]
MSLKMVCNYPYCCLSAFVRHTSVQSKQPQHLDGVGTKYSLSKTNSTANALLGHFGTQLSQITHLSDLLYEFSFVRMQYPFLLTATQIITERKEMW